MKNLLAITLVFILSLFVVEDSRGEIPDVMLKCERLGGGSYEEEDRYWWNLRFTSFYNIISLSGTANQYSAGISDTSGVWWSELTLKVSESEDLRYLYLDDNKLDRETLVLDLALKIMNIPMQYTCSILSNEKTIDDYLEDHGKVMQEFIDGARNRQLKKNKI
jgi:hypothetical protein